MTNKWQGIIHANSLHIPLADNSVHACVTSPPYYGLREYQIPPTIWDGDPNCEHVFADLITKVNGSTNGKVEHGSTLGGAGSPKMSAQTALNANGGQAKERVVVSGFCQHCNAWRGVLGGEPTVELYIDHMVQIFREVRRVLRSDGVCFMNLGDSYAQTGGCGLQGANSQRLGRKNVVAQQHPTPRTPPIGFKAKDLMLIPHRVAIALHADGWFVRNDIVWWKKAAMPESVRDRFTRDHEYVFHLVKSDRYFWDQEAVKEPASEDTHARYARARSSKHKYADGGPGQQTIARSFEHMLLDAPEPEAMPPLVEYAEQMEEVAVATHAVAEHGLDVEIPQTKQQQHPNRQVRGFNERWRAREPGVHPKSTATGSGNKQNESFNASVKDVVQNRYKRTVWGLGNIGYSGAHFATFVPEIPRVCILASTSEYGACADCGAQYVRKLEPSAEYGKYLGAGFHDHEDDEMAGQKQVRGENRQNAARNEGGQICADYNTVGWEKTCECATDLVVPAIVLDPFFGSGTSGMVAEELNRRWIGLDLGYHELQKKRTTNVQRNLL